MKSRALHLSVFGQLLLGLVGASCSGADKSSSGAGSGAPNGGTSSDAGSTIDAQGGTGDMVPSAGSTSASGSANGSAGSATASASGSGMASGGSSTGSNSSAPDADGSVPGVIDASTPAEAALPGWKLTWSDEFNGADGSAADPTKWTHDVGGTGWGNNELEYYTDGSQNAVVQGGNLVITATTQGAAQYHCSYGTCKYTSARLKTQGLFSQQYGRFEARAQMPTGKGLWPAIWALGDNISTVSWPACGEVDFMETVGTDISTNHGSLHMPSSYGPSGTYKLTNGATFAQAFHTFAFEWEPGTIRFYVDDQLYETQNKTSVPSGDTWEFEHPFFLLINVAVGGMWPGSPDSSTTFPQTLKVDYVRVYQKDGTEP